MNNLKAVLAAIWIAAAAVVYYSQYITRIAEMIR